jgi:hypothetical protein
MTIVEGEYGGGCLGEPGGLEKGGLSCGRMGWEKRLV